jgi:hypothetical protein
MKNFNLISPSDNGFEYTIRFQDPIKIMKNSKIDFKFAELVRAGEVVFNEEQIITLTANPEDCLPRFNIPTDAPYHSTEPATPFLNEAEDEEVNTMSIKIPAGVYSYQDFRTTLRDKLTEALERGLTDGACKTMVFQGFGVQTDLKDHTQKDLAFGIQYTFENRGDSLTPGHTPDNDYLELDASGHYQMNVDVENERTILKTSGGDDGELDGGAIINPIDRYVHRYFKSGAQPAQNNFENFIYCRGHETTGDQVGDIHIGFYNVDASGPLGVGTNRLFANKSGGVNAVNAIGPAGETTGENYLPVWLGIRVENNTGQVEIYQGIGDDIPNDTTEETENQFYDITKVQVVCSHPVYDLFDEEQQPQFFIQLYQTKGNYLGNWGCGGREVVSDARSFYRVYALTNAGDASSSYNMKEIYDSQIHRHFLNEKMEIGTGITYGEEPNSLEKTTSQLPYQVVVGMTHENQGWETIRYPKINVEEAGSSDPQCLLVNYTMSFTKELEDALNIPRGETATELVLQPNFILNENFGDEGNIHNYIGLLHNSNISNPWRREGYSIFIDLPCNNYKNLSDKLNGGFRKSVVANLPSPFASADIVEADNSNSKIVATYEPYQPVQSELKNNSISVNSFKITIVDMKTERLAKQLASSVVNFTIHCPNGDDDENENLRG